VKQHSITALKWWELSRSGENKKNGEITDAVWPAQTGQYRSFPPFNGDDKED
jgi:hypothetical protein